MPIIREGSFELEVTSPGDFLVEIIPAFLSVAKGAVANFQVKLTGSGGFDGAVLLSGQFFPAGVVPTFGKARLLPGETTIMAIQTPSFPKGRLGMTVRGTEEV